MTPIVDDTNTRATATTATVERTHTPGPWTTWTERSSGLRYIGKADETGEVHAIASLGLAQFPRGDDHVEADADLIAAAPELYGALARLIDAADERGELQDELEFSRARRVLAKARGEAVPA